MARKSRTRRAVLLVPGLLIVGLIQPVITGTAAAAPVDTSISAPDWSKAAGFGVSRAVRDLPRSTPDAARPAVVLPERGARVPDRGYGGDAALQQSSASSSEAPVSPPIQNFEGISNADNPFQLSPPDPDGDVGPNHYVQMLNVSFSVYDKTGTVLTGPTDIGDIWAGFEVEDCADNSGDPIVLHDQIADRWILTQFTTAGPEYFNCVALSTTADPTGSYYLYAFSTGVNFPDYPKYGVWPNTYVITTREFGPVDFSGVGIYGLERAAMLAGDPDARVVNFNLAPGDKPYLPGDGLLPSDFDGTRLPPAGSPSYLVGTQDDEGIYGAPYDAINVWAFAVRWRTNPHATFVRIDQLRVPEFDSAFPCGSTGRACIDQPDTTNKIDILSYRQRPTWRLAYRNFGTHEALVTNQSVEARPGIAGVRWYEMRIDDFDPSLYQAGTFAPPDGVNRWMGSVAQDKFGNMAGGYSVSSETVYPGIRYAGRSPGDPPGVLTRGEKSLIEGSGSQTGSNRWGDYTSMHVDPVDDCTFWYTNQYYETTSSVGWQTRIGSFTMAGC